MEWQKAVDSHGNEADTFGVPYNETFSQQEIKRLGFEVYRLYNEADDTTPDEEFETVPPPHVRQIPGNWVKINGIWIKK